MLQPDFKPLTGFWAIQADYKLFSLFLTLNNPQIYIVYVKLY